MARRIELKGIANSLNESFISRNNEFDGYWSIGWLKLFAIERGLSAVKFSFPIHKSNTSSVLINYIEQCYTCMLAGLLGKQRLPDSWVRDVSIIIDFDAIVEDSQLHNYPALGEPFKCYCQITDDNGRLYSSIIYGRCRPHSKVIELQSTRCLVP
ncbi:hypothetical protein BSR04_04670 [Serratia plymuthica]|nr:hypothetical protein BSR04_04670 [Serratia plymuthica]